MNMLRTSRSFKPNSCNLREHKLSGVGRVALATGLVLAAIVSASVAAQAAPRQSQTTRAHPAPRAAPLGQVFLNGRWVDASWCDATVPGPDGGPGGPGRGLCNASTPRR